MKILRLLFYDLSFAPIYYILYVEVLGVPVIVKEKRPTKK